MLRHPPPSWLLSSLKIILFVGTMVAVTFACTSMAIEDRHYVLDPGAQNLRGVTANDDRPEKDCGPEKLPDGTLRFRCVVHFMSDYEKLLAENARLRLELKDCQSK